MIVCGYCVCKVVVSGVSVFGLLGVMLLLGSRVNSRLGVVIFWGRFMLGIFCCGGSCGELFCLLKFVGVVVVV